jgi:hypothetical protein
LVPVGIIVVVVLLLFLAVFSCARFGPVAAVSAVALDFERDGGCGGGRVVVAGF